MSSVFGAGKEEGEQQSVEWLMARVGYCTASRFKDVLAKLKNGSPAKARQDYIWEIAIERLTGQPAQHYESAAMDHGTINEAGGRMHVEARENVMVMETGFHRHPLLEWTGGSPDGFIGDDGGVEIKCPFNSAIHLATLLDGMPAEHMAQIQGLLWVTGRKWWFFASYDPRLPPPLDLYVQRIERDQKYIDNLGDEVCEFLGEVDALLGRINSAAQGSGAVTPSSDLPDPAAAGPESAASQENTVADSGPRTDKASASAADYITVDQALHLSELCKDYKVDEGRVCRAAKVEKISLLLADQYGRAKDYIEKARK